MAHHTHPKKRLRYNSRHPKGNNIGGSKRKRPRNTKATALYGYKPVDKEIESKRFLHKLGLKTKK